MVDFECVHCENVISRDLDTFAGIVRCPKCKKTMRVFVRNNKLITTDYDLDDTAQMTEILSKKEVR